VHTNFADESAYIPCGGGLEYHHRSPANHRRRRKGRGYNWAVLILGNMNRETWSSRLGVERKADEPVSKSYCCESKEIKAGWSNSQELTNLAGSSKKGYVTKRAAQPMLIMITFLCITFSILCPICAVKYVCTSRLDAFASALMTFVFR
jgi:hypothetical protein